MQQRYHSNATTNIPLRSEINKSLKSNAELSKQDRISEKTISKWKKRDELTNTSSRPKTITCALSELEQLIAVNLRSITWWALDEITEFINPPEPEKIRSAVYRTFVREGVNRVPEKEKARKFKEYDPGYLHIDVTYLPRINGVKYNLFVAIDRATRTLNYQVCDIKSGDNGRDFLERCIEFSPVYITHTLTDNGLEFTNRLLKSKKEASCNKPGKFDLVCAENNIDHRCTKPIVKYQRAFKNTYLYGSFSPVDGDSFVYETEGTTSEIFYEYLIDFSMHRPTELKIIIIDNTDFHSLAKYDIPENTFFTLALNTNLPEGCSALMRTKVE